MFNNSKPRLVELFGIKVEADLAGHMLYVVNEDALGFIGRIGTTLGNAGGETVLLLSVDEAVTSELIAQVRALPGVKTAMALKF